MRTLIILTVVSAAAAVPAHAQVSTNDQALDSLKSTQAPAAPAAPAKPIVHHAPRHAAARPAHPAKPAALPVVPAAPPANPVIVPPPPVLPVHPRPMPPPVPIKPDAAGANTPITGGMRLTFGAGSADLNTGNDQALLDIAKRASLDPALEITITAWAPGTNEDPSTPRRLSLDRALAARAVLINAGIISDRIHAVAKGFANIEGGPPDRVDILVARPRSTPVGTPTLPPPVAAKPGAAKPEAATPASNPPASAPAGKS